MISPATAFAVATVGNSVACIALPRDTTRGIYLNGSEIAKNDEATCAWKFMGVAGLQAAGGLYLAEKLATSKEDKQKINGLIAGGALGNTALFALNGFCNEQVKTEMKAINMAMGIGVAGLAIKSMIDNK